MKAIKPDPDFVGSGEQGRGCQKAQPAKLQKLVTLTTRQDSEENRTSNDLSNGQCSSSALEQGQPPVDDAGVSSGSTICPAPLSRQFWKAGNYDDGLVTKIKQQSGKNYLHVHPLFLHSNATSHKWAFGAIAELLDNAIDEIENKATFANVDKTINPRDGSPALLIQDNGGGMDPETIRRCMSFGFSDKSSKLAIGQYGNGFKTGTMRLGADVIVFTRCRVDSVVTQSIGLLSYTFLTRMGYDRIVVPMVDYEFNKKTGKLEISHHYGRDHFRSNLSMLLQWSPYLTEAELLKQFDDIEPCGTKVIIYNLWLNDDGKMELDFDADTQDIRIGGDIKKIGTVAAWRTVNEQHISSRLHYSLRAYLSILYLRIPETFKILLRGQVVEHHNLADELKFEEYILYRPQSGGNIEGQVVTTIGFLKEAPHVCVHGFNVYHKNRLILPFWPVVSYADSRGRGVVGILEANFVEPTHNKQDFERTSLFQKLEGRLKEMTWEYWDFHCGLIGYQVKKKPRPIETPRSSSLVKAKPVILEQNSSAVAGSHMKRKDLNDTMEPESQKTKVRIVSDEVVLGQNLEAQRTTAIQSKYQEAANLVQENRKLRAKCLEYEKSVAELDLKATQLRSELGEVECEYDRLMAELTSLDAIKEEKDVHM